MAVRWFSFDGTNVKTSYGCYIQKGWQRPFLPEIESRRARLADSHGSLFFGSFYGEREFEIPCEVIGDDHDDLLSKLHSLRTLFDVIQGEAQLIFSDETDRYWLARFDGHSKVRYRQGIAEVRFDFICTDVFAYSTTEDTPTHTIDADPKTVSETTGGTAPIKPVWRLTPDAAVSGTVILENDTRGEEAQWDGELDGVADYLTIDSENQIVYKNGAESMAGFSGVFPLLSPNVANSIIVTGMTGDLDITYRDRYL